MFDPKIVENAYNPTASCSLCGSINGPYVDTSSDRPGELVYVCVHTCAPQIAMLAGYVSAEVVEQAVATAAELSAEVERLTGDLEREKQHKLIPASDVLALLEERARTTA